MRIGAESASCSVDDRDVRCTKTATKVVTISELMSIRWAIRLTGKSQLTCSIVRMIQRRKIFENWRQRKRRFTGRAHPSAKWKSELQSVGAANDVDCERTLTVCSRPTAPVTSRQQETTN